MSIFGDAVARPARRGESMWTREINVGGLERFVWPAVVALVVAILAATFLPMLWGWYPVFGRSMQPTLPNLGGYFKLEKLGDPARELRPNDIVVLGGQTLGYSVKRVAEIDPKRGIYVLGDNVDRSKDSSFGAAEEDPEREVWIPFTEVKGRASDLQSVTRIQRRVSRPGRARNNFEFSYPTFRVGCYSLAAQHDHVLILYPSGEVKRIEGRYQTRNGTLIRVERGSVPYLVDLNGEMEYPHFSALLMEWAKAGSSAELHISIERVEYGLEFTLPDGEKVYVRCILPPA